jgi:hypothetical protein
MKNESEKDVWLYRMIIAALGLTLAAAVVGAIVLAMTKQPAPDALVALGSAAIGGLAGFLVPTQLKG